MKPAAEPALFSYRPNRHPVHGHDGQEPLARRPPGRLWHQVPDAADALCVHTAGLSLTTVSSQERNAAPSQGQTERTSRTTNHSCTCTRTCASAGGTGASTNTTRRPSVAPSGTSGQEGEEEAQPHLRWRSLLIQQGGVKRTKLRIPAKAQEPLVRPARKELQLKNCRIGIKQGRIALIRSTAQDVLGFHCFTARLPRVQ